ncbi:MAG TPA: MFS transporter [Chthonomonadaceae bacterium]|nr:MFS transporter [Chthonomonadaceae bacterium]
MRAERARFVLIATLLGCCALVQECNEIVATSGLVSQAASSSLIQAWTLDALLAAFGSCIYAMRVDRMDRVTLAVRLLSVFGLSYGLLYLLFLVHAPGWARYGSLLVLNNQQAYLAVVLIWTLAKDVFSVGQATRLFGLLGSVTLIGSLLGNLIATAAGHWKPEAVPLLLLLNGGLTLLCAWLIVRYRGVLTAPKQPVAVEIEAPRGLSAALGYIWRERTLRYLSLATISTGAVWTIMTYHLLTRLAEITQVGAHAPGSLQTAYGLFTLARPVMQAVIQAALAGILIRRIGFRHIFLLTPITLLIGLALMACFGGIAAAAVALYLLYAIFGVEEPAAHAFLAQTPQELRGRVGALIEGFFAPAGYIAGAGLIVLSQRLSIHVASFHASENAFRLVLALLSALLGLWASRKLSGHVSAFTAPLSAE